MKFEWDPHKAEINFRKHGVSFDEAGSVFLDRLALSGQDPEHSVGESRYITFGMSSLNRLLLVCLIRIGPGRFESSAHAA